MGPFQKFAEPALVLNIRVSFGNFNEPLIVAVKQGLTFKMPQIFSGMGQGLFKINAGGEGAGRLQ
jgi:hypothetical protein